MLPTSRVLVSDEPRERRYAMGGAFYEQIGPDRYRATRHAAGPWSPDSQHMGPPAALIVRDRKSVG